MFPPPSRCPPHEPRKKCRELNLANLPISPARNPGDYVPAEPLKIAAGKAV